MQEKGPERFILTKAYEIAYALFRVADTMQENELAGKLRGHGAQLIELIAGERYKDSAMPLQVLECLVKFAGDVNAMSMANCDTLLREIYALETAIVEYRHSGGSKATELDLSEIFSKEEPKTVQEVFGNMKAGRVPSGESDQPIQEGVPSGIRVYPESSVAREIAKSPVRQSAILEKIRQSGNCRMKDIQEVLPGCSERTLRYDLQSLIEQNLIERVGTGGPAVSYRIRQSE